MFWEVVFLIFTENDEPLPDPPEPKRIERPGVFFRDELDCWNYVHARPSLKRPDVDGAVSYMADCQPFKGA